MDPSPSDIDDGRRRRVRRWYVLVIPALWLVWVTLVGWNANRICIEDLQMREVPMTSAARASCERPNWNAPFRGLELSWRPDAVFGYWLFGTLLAVTGALAVLYLSRRRPPSSDAGHPRR